MSESDREDSGSIENVMKSIRRAIEAEAEAPDAAEAPVAQTSGDSDVIHLTQMVTSDGQVVDLREERRMREALQAVEREVAEGMAAKASPAPEATPLDAPHLEEPQQDNLGKVDPIKAAGAAAITKYLSQHPTRSLDHGPQVGGGQSLEAVVRQALVPHVREWLEANLAPLVHNIVREEIEEMVRRKKDE